MEWCYDDEGHNILYKKNGQERYPDFKLYIMIAKTAHNHTPDAQLERPIFKKFLIKPHQLKQINKDNLIDIDAMILQNNNLN